MAVVDGAPHRAATQPPAWPSTSGSSTVKMAWLEDGRIVDSSQQHNDFPAVVAVQGGDLLVGKDAVA